jgi:hypothetical protein
MDEVGVLVIAKLGHTHTQEHKLLATNGMRQAGGEGEKGNGGSGFLNF